MVRRNWLLLPGAIAWSVIALWAAWPVASRGPLVPADGRWVLPAAAGWAFCFLFWKRRA